MSWSGPIYYDDGVTEVRLGDRVHVTSWFVFRTQGDVVYLSGVSPVIPSMEAMGVSHVGIAGDDGSHVGTIVLPETGRLKRSVKFLGRGTSEFTPIAPGEDPFDDSA